MTNSEELKRYVELFRAAFDEVHDAVLRYMGKLGHYVGPHHDYPVMSVLESGFPHFHDAGFYREGAPRDFVGSIRPRGLGALLAGQKFPEISFSKGAALATFLKEHEVGKRLDLLVYDGTLMTASVDHMVDDAVERYLHLHGRNPAIDGAKRDRLIRPLIRGTLLDKLPLRLVVPIALTHFEVDHFPLTSTTYITRLPKKIQLARARMDTLGTGAVESVVGAATHAFVSSDWQLEVDNIRQIRSSLSQLSSNVVDAMDSFFGALRVATGVRTGYAQVLWVPKKWALNYFCDLTPLYGTTTRQYPSDYDNYGWTRSGPTVTRSQLVEARRIYRAVLSSNSEAIRLALKRLNSSLTRPDAADAILDGVIGLELLLGDDENQSLAYKLRLRAAALAMLGTGSGQGAEDIATKVRRLYSARSAIVHGRRRRRSRQVTDQTQPDHAAARDLASDLLRFVLDVLLTHPDYQDPSRIDVGLLLRGDKVLQSPLARPSKQPLPKRSRGNRKKRASKSRSRSR